MEELEICARVDIAKALDGVAMHQPAPLRNDQACIQDKVIADIVERKRVGLERYGTLLQSFNGRDALLDAYQEALDLVIYLRQELDERAEKKRLAELAVLGDPARAE